MTERPRSAPMEYHGPVAPGLANAGITKVGDRWCDSTTGEWFVLTELGWERLGERTEDR